VRRPHEAKEGNDFLEIEQTDETKLSQRIPVCSKHLKIGAWGRAASHDEHCTLKICIGNDCGHPEALRKDEWREASVSYTDYRYRAGKKDHVDVNVLINCGEEWRRDKRGGNGGGRGGKDKEQVYQVWVDDIAVDHH